MRKRATVSRTAYMTIWQTYKGHSYNSIGSIDGTSLGPIFFPTSLACFCSAVDTQSRKRFTINRSSRTSWSGLEIKIIRYAEF